MSDVIVADFPDFPDYMGQATVSDDGRYVFLAISESCDTKCLLWYFDLGELNQIVLLMCDLKFCPYCIRLFRLFLFFFVPIRNDCLVD